MNPMSLSIAKRPRRYAGHSTWQVRRKIEAEGLKPRAITRDLDWGIPASKRSRLKSKSSTCGLKQCRVSLRSY
ncbi:MAG: hypothetical protein U0Z26_15210 [Anaerolineales bacterium]